jgi:hypothetical protein
VAAYRVYKLGTDGHISEPPEVLECADDDTAVAQAKQLLNGSVIEVWNEARVVARLDPPGSAGRK